MEQKETTTETNAETIVTPEAENDSAAKIAALETEKAKILDERENYKKAYLKEVDKNGSTDESEDDKLRRIVREENATSRISQIDKEKEDLLQKTLKDNKELKLALQNKGGVSAAANGSTETVAVKDTTITPEQAAYFKSRNWNEKDIERYKKNIRK